MNTIRCTAKLRWWKPAYVEGLINIHDEDNVLQQAWEDIETGELHWRDIEIEEEPKYPQPR